MEVMASTSASSTSLSAASDPFDVESDIDSETELTVVSLLHRLKSPTAADISRARKTKKNDPPRCKRHCRGVLSSGNISQPTG